MEITNIDVNRANYGAKLRNDALRHTAYFLPQVKTGQLQDGKTLSFMSLTAQQSTL